MQAFAERSAEVLSTLVSNLQKKDDRLFQESVSEEIDEYLLPVLKHRIATHGQNFLDLVADQLRHPPVRGRKVGVRTRRRARLGVTVIVHQNVSGADLASK